MIRIFKYFKLKETLFIGISLAFIVFQVWLDLKLPDYMSQITRLVETPGSEMKDILIQGGYMLLCALGSMAAAMVVGFFAARVAAGLSKTLRGKVYDQTMSFSMGEMNRFSTSSLINRTTNDITQIQTLIAIGLQAIIKAPILAVWAILKISGKHWEWSAATAVAIMVLIVMLAMILLIAVPKFKKIQVFTDKINRITREHLSGIRVVRAYNADSFQETKFAETNDDLTSNNMTANRVMAVMMPGMTLINAGLTLTVYWIGSYLIDAASMTDRLGIFSDMIVFSSYAMQVIMSFMLLVMIFILLPRAQVSAKRILEVLNTKQSIHDPLKEKTMTESGTVEFSHVYFKYPDAGDYVLKDVSFQAKKGETVAFIGATGSGKTTLVNLIPRFYDATQGEILVNGVNVKDVNQKNLHERIGYVPQKTVMFAGTVDSNVRYGNTGKNTEKDQISMTQRAVAIAQGTEFVEKMEGSYEASVSQNGTNLSGGQKQRLSIARAIAKDPEIYVFDDSFSALDYKTDHQLRKALKTQTGNTTKLIVAQRIGTIRHADQIIVLDHGTVVGHGTHEELMKTCPTYQEIAESQLSKEEIANA